MIEPAQEQDGCQIKDLTANTSVFSSVDIACVEELWEAYLRQGEASGYHFLVYRCGERVLGYACFGPTPLTDGVFDLYWLAVAEDVRRQGVARALVGQMEERVRGQHGRMILVETSGTPAYAPARRCYESFGYRYEAAIHDFYAQGDDLIILAKRMEGSASLLT